VHRIHFTSDDLARVRHLPALGPLAESLLSLSVLRSRGSHPMFDGFREHVRIAVDVRYDVVLNTLMPAKDLMFDLISLAGQLGSFEETAESLLATPRHHMRGELIAFTSQFGKRLPVELHDMSDSLAARRGVISSLSRYHDVAIAPRWSGIRTRLDADRHARSQIMLDRGIDGLLSTLHPSLRWEPPCLINKADSLENFRDFDSYLDGRGMLLAPSFFLRSPVVLKPVDANRPDILIYPAQLDSIVWANTEPHQALANLLGRTRATVLQAISDGPATTTQLANRVGASAASISQHTAVLRDAGLITSTRYRNTVHHMLASAGTVLLNGG
jgi:DNA-binding transcriptional ArsR family regulator